MKKTLITLAALAVASVAQAAITTNSYTADDFSNGVLTLDTTLDYTTNWTLQATITIGEGSYNEWGSPALATGGDAMSGSGLQVYLVAGDEKALRTVWFGNSHDSSVMTGTHAGDILTLTYTYIKETDQLNVAYTLVRDGATYNDNVNNDGWYKATGSVVKPASISSLSTVINDNMTGWSIDSITTIYGIEDAITPSQPDAGQAIPEPATATLSLLALAGLAARRRRK